ncbi:MAG TPA: aminotransferase class V-fold PLP-dependent enzyme [Chitinophagales bacterium]|nr:aminotransferase class V-fold PLP-dependent enzyme [Chitinophagales bacterium]
MQPTDSIQNVSSIILEKQKTISFFEQLLNAPIYFTTSCTTALELAAMAIGIQPGDEVIVPSYTFVGTVNAFAKLGATIVFIDVEPNTMCLDISLLEKSITSKTKAIVPVHYAGNSCNMQAIIEIAKAKNIFVIEDAAQCIFSYQQQKHVGTLGDIGCISFDYAKNIECGQGGLVIVNNPDLIDKIDKAYHNGTNKKDFLNGISQNFEWQTLGSNFVLSDIHFSILYPQILDAENIQRHRKEQWNFYYEKLQILEKENLIHLQPALGEGNAHIFYFKTNERNELLNYLRKNDIEATFHYVPLHSSTKGKEYRYVTQNDNTTIESKRIIRLPLGKNIDIETQHKTIQLIFSFYKK